jgi:hypothetical protein
MILIGTLQLLLAVAFAAMAFVARRYGAAAQRAAEADAVRQGLPEGVLARHGIRIEESKAEMALPLAIAAVFGTIGALNLAGASVGRTLTWILQPLMLLAGGFITAGQVFVVRYVQSAIRKSDDPALRRADTRSLMAAANAQFPAFVRPLIVVRFLLATLGSLLILLLLAT